jgi:transposase
MQGKEASEQETLKCSAGIDVGKDWLDAHILPVAESKRVANTSVGIAQLKRWLLRHKVELVAVEATGKWHRPLCRSLAASQIAVAVTDPYRVRMFAKAQGILAKTDRLDAKVLASFARVMGPPCRALAAEVFEEMQELVTARAAAVGEDVALQNQLASAVGSYLKRQLARRLKQLTGHISALEKRCLGLIKANESLARRYEILTSIPGFGDIVAMTLIANLPELGTLTDKQVGALAGLAPVADDSGKRQGVRVIWGGRTVVRTILYLAALSASKHNTDMKLFKQRLKAFGKEPNCILIAIARKLAVLANLLVAQDRLWLPQAPSHA